MPTATEITSRTQFEQEYNLRWAKDTSKSCCNCLSNFSKPRGTCGDKDGEKITCDEMLERISIFRSLHDSRCYGGQLCDLFRSDGGVKRIISIKMPYLELVRNQNIPTRKGVISAEKVCDSFPKTR